MSEPTKDELYEQAQDADIAGRDSMTKQDLVEALEQVAEEAPKREPRMGVYVLESGDNPSIVAGKLFDRRSRGLDLVLANPGVDWVEGAEIQIPQDES
ncbi:Rho termination factor N-terminal domain-containing protein [Gemmatimonas sp.]|uniref:Rho termination factor N-terminal domain-containing protein n=1 Tax=Gemmatimonas sp. TaxID=1962908 RepID=UPI0035668950